MYQGEVELVQVSQAAMDEFRGPGRSARGPVTHLDDAGTQTPAGGIERNTSSRDTATYHEEVHGLARGQFRQGKGTLFRIERRSIPLEDRDFARGRDVRGSVFR